MILLGLLLSGFAHAQVQTEDQCKATVRARASLSLDTEKIKQICENFPMEVVDCALTEVQSAPLSGDLNKSLRHCRLEYTVISNY